MAAAIESSTPAVLLATFFVGDALCALDASGVQEVIRVESVTPVRHAPEEVMGVMNLRGKIVTLLDPRIILGLGKSVDQHMKAGSSSWKIATSSWACWWTGRATWWRWSRGEEEALPANIPTGQARFFQKVCRSGGHVIAVLNPSAVLNENKA